VTRREKIEERNRKEISPQELRVVVNYFCKGASKQGQEETYIKVWHKIVSFRNLKKLNALKRINEALRKKIYKLKLKI